MKWTQYFSENSDAQAGQTSCCRCGQYRRRSRESSRTNHRHGCRRCNYAIELNASVAAENFAKRLPMKVVWEDFGKLERIARLSERLDVGRDPVVKSPVRGTFAYYVPWGNLCLFRIGGNAPSRDLVELGAVDETALQAVIQSGGREVELRAR